MVEPTETPYLRAAFLAGPLSAAVSVLVTLAVMAVAGATSGSAADVVRSAGRTWLTAIGSGITVDGTAITIVPVGSWLVGIALVAAIARWVLVDPVDELPAFVASAGGVLGLVAAVVAAATSTDGSHVNIVRAAAAGFIAGSAGAEAVRVGADGPGVERAAVVQGDLDFAGTFNHVIVRDDVPLLIEHAAGAGTLGRHFRKEEAVHADAAGVDVDHAAVHALVHQHVDAFLGC